MKTSKIAIMTIALAFLMFTGNAMADTYLFQDYFDSENAGVGVLNYNNFANWNVTRGAVDLIGSPGFYDFFPANGLYVDLDGSRGAAGTMESKTAFNLTPGNYTLEFYLAGNQRGFADDTVTVTLGTFVNETITLASGVPFTAYEFDFNVSSPTSAKIVFSHQGGDNVGLLLDGVELEQVPEPTTMLLLGFGLIGLAGVRRFRK